jgi:dual specificity protein kinase YAK1
MNMSPTSPYTSFSPHAQAQGQGQGQGQSQSQTLAHSQSTRQSPTRTNPYISPPNSYYSPPGMSSLRTTPTPPVACCQLPPLTSLV